MAHISIMQYCNKLLLLNVDSVKQFVFVLGCVMKCFIWRQHASYEVRDHMKVKKWKY